MRRREFIALVGGAALGHPLDALAQPGGRLRRVGFLTAASSSVFSSLYATFVQAMHQLGYEEHKDYITEVRTAEGRYERFPELARELVEQKPDVLLTAVAAAIRYLQQATKFAIRNRLPSIFSQREYAVSGGLMSYGENLSDFFGRAAFFVDKIFKGTNPGDIPVEQPTRFHLTINRKTADALGLTIPSQLYIFADEVIE